MREASNHHERHGFYATALLGALLFAFILLGREAKAPVTLPDRLDGCRSIITGEGDVARPGTYLVKGFLEDGRCSLSLEAVLKELGGLNGGMTARASAALQEKVIALEQKIVVTRPTPDAIALELKPLDAPVKLAWGKKLNLNEATVDDLCLIPFMKRDHAEAIAWKRVERPWRSLDELEKIKGIGPKTIEKWEKYLIVENPVHSHERFSIAIP